MWKKPQIDIQFSHTYTQEEFWEHLYIRTKRFIGYGKKTVVVGKETSVRSFLTYHQRKRRFIKHILQVVVSNPESKNSKKIFTEIDPKLMGSIVIVEDDPNYVRSLVVWIVNQKDMNRVPLIFKISSKKFHEAWRNSERYPPDTGFIEDNLDYKSFNLIYKDSLKRFEQKCMVRDAWDMFQFLKKTVDVPGAILEVGSYKGHSGWLLYKFCEIFGISKTIYLCDTFKQFPKELLGLDFFWPGTHQVNFQLVKQIFSPIKNIKISKGDIKRTLKRLPRRKYSFVYVDVDSYGSTRVAAEIIYPQLSKGGVFFSQDYGKPHCLGARIAIDEYFSSKKAGAEFFSFWSGCKIFVK